MNELILKLEVSIFHTLQQGIWCWNLWLLSVLATASFNYDIYSIKREIQRSPPIFFCRLLCAIEGKYLDQEVYEEQRDDDFSEEGDTEHANFSCSFPNVTGRGFIEVLYVLVTESLQETLFLRIFFVSRDYWPHPLLWVSVAAFLTSLDPDHSFLWAGYTGYDDNDDEIFLSFTIVYHDWSSECQGLVTGSWYKVKSSDKKGRGW